MLKPYILTPTCKDYIWGGSKLKELYNKQSDSDIIAESWELSCHKDGASYLEDGSTLAELIKRFPLFAGTKAACYKEFPLLIKLIDSKQNLSIQVHPDDSYALANENQYGKTEMWYIISCTAGAGVYCGFKEACDTDTVSRHLNDGTICDLLNFVEVKAGDTLFIEAGTVHAICGGIVICEIQQSSSVTYRMYDYGRVGADGEPRKLHIERALDVVKSDITVDVNSSVKVLEQGYKLLAECDYFCVHEVCGTLAGATDNTSFNAITYLADGELMTDCGKLNIASGQTVFIPAGLGQYVATSSLMILTKL